MCQRAGGGEKGTCVQVLNLPKTGYLTCLYSGVTLHSWFLGVSTVSESRSCDVLIRTESLTIFKEVRGGPPNLKTILFPPALRTRVTEAPFYFYQLTWSPFLAPLSPPPSLKKKKKRKKKRKTMTFLETKNPTTNLFKVSAVGLKKKSQKECAFKISILTAKYRLKTSF